MLPLHDNVPTRRTPVVTIGLIAANFVVWIWELQHRESTVDHYAYYPCSVQGPCLGPAAQHHLPAWEGAFSSMFMHASWLHILGNMLFLWIFGNNVEDALGRVRFFLWYVAAGLAATALQTFVTLAFAGTAAASVPSELTCQAGAPPSRHDRPRLGSQVRARSPGCCCADHPIWMIRSNCS